MEREYKEVVCPITKTKVKLKAWLNGHEKFVVLNDEKKPLETQMMLIEQVVVEVDGDKKDVVEKVLDLHGADVDFVIREITNSMQNSSYVGKKKES